MAQAEGLVAGDLAGLCRSNFNPCIRYGYCIVYTNNVFLVELFIILVYALAVLVVGVALYSYSFPCKIQPAGKIGCFKKHFFSSCTLANFWVMLCDQINLHAKF